MVRLDVGGRDVQRLAQLAGDAGQRGRHFGGGHGQLVEAHAVEPLGEGEHGLVAAAAHLRQDLPDRTDGTALVENGPRQQRRERA